MAFSNKHQINSMENMLQSLTDKKQDAITNDTYLSSFNVEENINLIDTGSGNSIPLSFDTLTQTNNTIIDLANEKQDTITTASDIDVKSLDVAGRMTVPSSGNIGIGTTSPFYPTHIMGRTVLEDKRDSYSRLVLGNVSEGGFHHMDAYSDASNPKFFINYYSGLQVRVPSISYSSDDRIKTNETDISNATQTLLKLRPQIYKKYKNFDCSGDFTVESGLIAQEVYYQAPELRYIINLNNDTSGNVMIPDEVTLNTDYDIQNDLDYEKLGWGEGIVSINYTDLIPYLIKSVQEQNKINEDLLKRVSELENNT